MNFEFFNQPQGNEVKKTLLVVVLLTTVGGAVAQGAPGSVWASLTYNPSPIRGSSEDGNTLLQGRVEQGLIVGNAGGFRVNTFGAVTFSTDNNGLSYNNKVSPALGVKLQRDLGSSGIVEMGMQVVHQNNFRGVTSGPSSGTGVQAFINVWSGWDLKK